MKHHHHSTRRLRLVSAPSGCARPETSFSTGPGYAVAAQSSHGSERGTTLSRALPEGFENREDHSGGTMNAANPVRFARVNFGSLKLSGCGSRRGRLCPPHLRPRGRRLPKCGNSTLCAAPRSAAGFRLRFAVPATSALLTGAAQSVVTSSAPCSPKHAGAPAILPARSVRSAARHVARWPVLSLRGIPGRLRGGHLVKDPLRSTLTRAQSARCLVRVGERVFRAARFPAPGDN